MSRSYERINYALRPAKTVERKMLVELFGRLSHFGRVNAYRYVGFGSTYFTDFSLIHRSLGISEMISLEHDINNAERFEFNKPFKCIEVRFGESNDLLPALGWDIRTICWLDYDDKLDASMLEDVRCFAGNAISGSVVLVTINAKPDVFDNLSAEETRERRMEEFVKRVGPEKVPTDIKSTDFKGWGEAEVCRRVLRNELLETLTERNGGRNSGNHLAYEQLVYFHYADGAKMTTTGGIIYDEGNDLQMKNCDFENLDFIRYEDEPYQIEIPRLTYREVQFLDARMPSDTTGLADFIPPSDLTRYAQVYRYFPKFIQTDI